MAAGQHASPATKAGTALAKDEVRINGDPLNKLYNGPTTDHMDNGVRPG